VKIRVAHLRTQGIDFAVFDADAVSHSDADRQRLLADLIVKTRLSGLKVDKAALAFSQSGQLTFFGTPDLVQFLANNGISMFTHTLDLP